MSKFTKLTEEQLLTKRNFIENYLTSHNAATGSLFDANANVAHKNIATMEAELNKDINIKLNSFLARRLPKNTSAKLRVTKSTYTMKRA